MDSFTQAYIEAALWSSTDDDGGPLDRRFDVRNIDDATLSRMETVCADFQACYRDLYIGAGWTDEQAGHDFWLTRNRHGAGFWDRGIDDNNAGRLLTEAAHGFGTFDLYVGDDGLIYGS